MNSMLKSLIVRAPNISFALASARLAIRKALNLFGAYGPKPVTWSQIAFDVRVLLNDTLQSVAQAKDRTGKEDRWHHVKVTQPIAAAHFSAVEKTGL